eukprot:scaffold91114_cov64-Phaeocystis_antarctica.AAC.10
MHPLVCGRACSLCCPPSSASKTPLSGVRCAGRPEMSSAKWDVLRLGGSHVTGLWLRALDREGSSA